MKIYYSNDKKGESGLGFGFGKPDPKRLFCRVLDVQIDRIPQHTTCFQEVNKRKERERQELRQEGEEAKRAKLTDTL
jgi:hypothetical protein